jgi:hypothetical protein
MAHSIALTFHDQRENISDRDPLLVIDKLYYASYTYSIAFFLIIFYARYLAGMYIRTQHYRAITCWVELYSARYHFYSYNECAFNGLINENSIKLR